MAFNIDPELLDAYCEKHGFDLAATSAQKKQFVLAKKIAEIKTDALEHKASKLAEASRIAEIARLAPSVITIT